MENLSPIFDQLPIVLAIVVVAVGGWVFTTWLCIKNGYPLETSWGTALHPTTDREALSALFDGELAGDAARFALKRLDHDQDWRDSCERWQVVGDVLRGAANPRMPSTFAARVHDALRAAAPRPCDTCLRANAPSCAARSGRDSQSASTRVPMQSSRLYSSISARIAGSRSIIQRSNSTIEVPPSLIGAKRSK